MVEIELNAEEITNEDNTINVEMSNEEIWFVKSFIKKYHPKKIVEVGISAGGSTVNLLRWKDKDAQLFSVDIAEQWYRDSTKLSGFMADELDVKDNWKVYRGYDYLDVYEEIGGDIDCIIIDTVHAMPGEFLTFLAALPQLKEGCIVILHDIHLNMLNVHINEFGSYKVSAHCTGLLHGGVSSNKKWGLKTDFMSNISAFVVDKSTLDNIKDIFHILCSAWYYFPYNLDLDRYSEFIKVNYSEECYALFNTCLKLQSKYFNYLNHGTAQMARVDIINYKNENNAIEFLNTSEDVDVMFPDWFKRDDGEGAVIQTKTKSFDLILKCINEGILKIYLRGPDIRDRFGTFIPSYVNFNKFRIDGTDVIEDKVTVWHSAPYIFEKNVNDGEILSIHFEWESYE